MKLVLNRFWADEDSTIGTIFCCSDLECFSLEDEFREVKVPGETRIPSGEYIIKLRTDGGMHEKYSKKFTWHEGMLELQGVPNFTYIYIHIGNDDDDTSGCLLVGTSVTGGVDINCKLTNSTGAYERLYKKVLVAMQSNAVRGRDEQVTIKIIDSCGKR